MKGITLFVIIFLSLISSAQTKIFPGLIWLDRDSVQINAHGGCVVFHNGYYYLFGEDRTGMVSNGVSCYKSKDFYRWERVGLALTLAGKPTKEENDIAVGRTLERPKVIFNEKNNKWVMWSHWENGNGYDAAKVCVAISDNIEGPYNFHKAYRPNNHDSRDQTLFVDDDGKAYYFGSTEMNTNTTMALLRDDFLEPSAIEAKILIGGRFEAASIFKVGDIYYGLFSGCTGWAPNPGRSAFTTNIFGNWIEGSNFAVDPLKEITYRSQSNFVFKFSDKEKAYIYMGDRWDPNDVGKSHLVWLPISMRSGYPVVKWYDKWDLSVFDTIYRYKRALKVRVGHVYSLLEKTSDRLVSKPANGFQITEDDDDINLSLEFIATKDSTVYKLKDKKSGNFIGSLFGTLRLIPGNNDSSQNWRFHLQDDGYYKIENVKECKFLSLSGSSTFSGTFVYLNAYSEKIPQEFGVYFDSKKYDYEEADIFSASCIEGNVMVINDLE
ncbi:family 43 glycosylhydrolase [Sunxiuqinia indica]|uniref:family 43 glycosylhydrolase n=1 Tax=Sunxiuqinia indica TaxID=2692584 RepID=UPI0013587151|nr:family 43 glycosylhydrolase [Sunxiuqinia indica]